MQGENAAIQFTGARSQRLGKLSDAAGLTARPEDPADPAAPRLRVPLMSSTARAPARALLVFIL